MILIQDQLKKGKYMEWTQEQIDYFKNLNYERLVYPNYKSRKITSLNTFFDRMSFEAASWETASSNFDQIKQFYRGIMSHLDIALNHEDDDTRLSQLKIATKHSSKNIFPNISFKSPLASFLINECSVDTNFQNLLIKYLHDKKNIHRNHLVDGTHFYLFHKLHFLIDENSSSAEKISYMYKKYNEDLKAFNEEANSNIDELKGSIDYLTKMKDEVSETILLWQDETISNNNKYFDERNNKLIELETKYNDSITRLEKTFSEKLRLSSPAKYWSDFAKTKKRSGKRWLTFANIIGLFIIAYSSGLMTNLPGLISNNGQYDIENIVRWSILSALLYTTMFYLLRLFVRLTMSSFHLANDAEERFQLTHQYLALLKTNSLDKAEKDIILQSLFSRADSGLLKGDSSPTMPDGLIGNIIKMATSKP